MILILLPAFNEEKSLLSLIPKIDQVLKSNKLTYEILICDDGSTDATGSIVEICSKDFPITLLKHSVNRGLGETCRDLFENAAAVGKSGDIVIRMDCDDTHEPLFIPSMLAKIHEGFDIVLASRFQPGGGQQGISSWRAFVSKCANIFTKLFFPIRGVMEYSCGYRAYRIEIIQRAVGLYGNKFIELKDLGFSCTLEKLIKLKLLGARITEVPFVLRYDQKRSLSKMVMSVTALGYVILVLAYYWPSRSGWRFKYRNTNNANAAMQ